MSTICKLCKEKKDLKSSHLIPKLLYRYLRKKQGNNENLNGLLILDSKNNKIDVTQRQWQKHIFCHDCEILLSKNETKFARILRDINDIEKKELKKTSYITDYEKVKGVMSFDEFKQTLEAGYFNKENVETLKYFSASFLLRQLYVIEHNLAKEDMKMLEDYILGQGEGNFNLFVNLNIEKDFLTFCSSIPLDKQDDFKHYNFIVPNVWFHLIFDRDASLGKPNVMITPSDFYKNEIIIGLLSKFYEDVRISKKAEKAMASE
ncbi:hypothetical protein EXT47_05185 [Pseudoalteromonas sp. CO342X]|uniref:hypothetical protein n=1 Tax=Pseudoalteromonas sp. CO342X TaxID=1777270 RepID=UPI00102312C9|nr:hypothetical protein [Pseudoalteromonas sp. CO342X]RZG16722.1 hypothetical protein EXT47_05185 [Pseudoalteromonas sp. CO342X]